jgi:predicted nucleotidyltransferase
MNNKGHGGTAMSELRSKTKSEIDAIVNELITWVSPIFGEKLKKVVLYGSYARGDSDAESDIDVMFMVDEEDEGLRKYRNSVRTIEREIDWKYDVLVCGHIQNYNRFQQYLNDLPFYSNVNREGVIYYEQ